MVSVVLNQFEQLETACSPPQGMVLSTPRHERMRFFRGVKAMATMRRLYGFVVTGEAIGEIARHGKRTIDVSSPVPDSATFFSAHFDHARNAFVCVFEDVSFSPVAEGALIPVDIGPTITRVAPAVVLESSETKQT